MGPVADWRVQGADWRKRTFARRPTPPLPAEAVWKLRFWDFARDSFPQSPGRMRVFTQPRPLAVLRLGPVRHGCILGSRHWSLLKHSRGATDRCADKAGFGLRSPIARVRTQFSRYDPDENLYPDRSAERNITQQLPRGFGRLLASGNHPSKSFEARFPHARFRPADLSLAKSSPSVRGPRSYAAFTPH